MMLTGGVDTDNSVFAYLCFSKTPALSKQQMTRPFDAEADGMMLGEGIGMMVLKRLKDAERDGDQIYAVIRGIGTSSDGRFKSIYAPRPSGQLTALRRAYAGTGVAPETVQLIEAHGTGTMAGDPAEVEALRTFFNENQAEPQSVALGSVKSQIGHTKAAAGAASLIKTALALHHKVLPPTINISKPNPRLDLEKSAFYLNTEARPWIKAAGAPPRRAGVSSFGFGGTNYHVVLEEYQEEHQRAYRMHQAARVVLLHAPTPTQLVERCEAVLHQLKSNNGERSYAELVAECQSLEIPVAAARLGFAAASLQDACTKLQTAIGLLIKPLGSAWEHPLGIFYQQGAELPGKVVALFPGQGSQYLKMGRELTIDFPELRQTYGYLDNLLAKDRMHRISNIVFPQPAFEPEQQEAQEQMLRRTEYAQPAIAAVSVGLYKILRRAGFQPDVVAGHSFGELTALWAAEAISDEDYFFLVKARAKAMAAPDQPGFDAGAMLAVTGDAQQVEVLLQAHPQVTIANWNSNQQVVLAGSKPEIAKVQQILESKGFSTVPLPVSGAFHTSLVAHAQQPFAKAIEAVTFKAPVITAYTNVTAAPYPSEPAAVKRNLQNHMCCPVSFKQEIENIYNAGGRFFVEVGPRSILTNLVKEILGDRPYVAIALNGSRQKDSSYQFQEAIARLRVAGLALKDVDPYQVPKLLPESRNPKGFYVRLNGCNYVSDKTKSVFEKALNDGFRIQLAVSENGNGHGKNGNGHGNGNGGNGFHPVPQPLHPQPLQTIQVAAPAQEKVTVAASSESRHVVANTSPITLATSAVTTPMGKSNGYDWIPQSGTKNGYASSHTNHVNGAINGNRTDLQSEKSVARNGSVHHQRETMPIIGWRKMLRTPQSVPPILKLVMMFQIQPTRIRIPPMANRILIFPPFFVWSSNKEKQAEDI
ncbi:type I polyketide synthase [Leptolyngbya sp. 7M]|uniref:type I polyketide synthase n=1 Tax=Leptolyngbya sp. 7M TaxID=2812896 RepID=UPI001B8D3906|nr:type I polyketide synthase [Leptolyngbya sp. 7M]QYO62204.1 acyltransferase domain-containing protein [Leptolyngbya sp. 7M]